ncbi:hypothetical protein [Bartonella sp. WD12.1]|uniref:hypothetical protein n=1 Tax=Bartonella sp. WD12.1 TaxID=1933903 RepID=UPI0009C7C2E9|nr:hypothetical protein [Bartonella sp. WD12.1]OPB30192.1 hypothetical protein BWD121_012440 [Bartonella sp. WD12.1]
MRSSNGRSDCGEGSSNGEDGEDAAETSGIGENEEGDSEDGGGENTVSKDSVGRGGVGEDDKRGDAVREEDGSEVISGKKGEVVGEDEAGVGKAGMDEANTNGRIYPLPWESTKKTLTQTKINICFFKVLKYRGKKCVIKKDML